MMHIFIIALTLLVNLAPCNANGGKGASECAGINAISPKCKSSELGAKRDYFYIGGEYQSTNIRPPINGTFVGGLSDNSIVVNQMYVEKLSPIGGVTKPHPIILMSAGLPAGTVRFSVLASTPSSLWIKLLAYYHRHG
jgi:hypothetical protein